jgi:glyoxylase-like metal-dependent hydrolase (beta-lactamase superfamily II)
MSEYEIHAIRYGHDAKRKRGENVLRADDHDAPMPMDFFVWAIVGGQQTFILDTGFDADRAKARGRDLVRPIAQGLREIGVEPDSVKDVVISHMHWDHSGNHDLFPQARYHIQDAEMKFCTGRCMCHEFMRAPFEFDDVSAMVKKVYEGRAVFHDGAEEIADGISLHWIGGHTEGTQVMRVRTKRGWVVLAADASHYYENFETKRPFSVVNNLAEMIEGYHTMVKLADSAQHVIPGHDPLVLKRYPESKKGLAGTVRLDVAPVA